MSLQQARKAHQEAKQLLSTNIDPAANKRIEKVKQEHMAADTFQAIATEYQDKRRDVWSDSHAKKWRGIIGNYAVPTIGKISIANITAPMVLDVIRKPEKQNKLTTAHTLLQQIGQIFRYAVQTGRCQRDITADLKGALKPKQVQHMAAILDPQKVGGLLRDIDHYEGTIHTRIALSIAIRIFQRPGNIRLMQWGWIDFDNAMLTIPPADMKRNKHGKQYGKPHLVPLSRQVIALLKEIHPITGADKYVFTGLRGKSSPMSNNTLNNALRNMGYSKEEIVPHGFRSMARTLLAETYPHINQEAIEAQLAHSKKGSLGSAYDRAEYMQDRTKIMQVWSDYLDRLQGSNKPLRLIA